jgi:hypothetical protein
VGACSANQVEACDYPSRGLAFTVRQGFTVTDPLTGRVLPLLARIPDMAGPVPVVIWSHGGGFNETGHQQAVGWGETLAMHGYAVVHIAHVGLDATALTALCTMASVPSNECAPAADVDATGLVALVKTQDTIAVLDQLATLSDTSVGLGGPAIDLGRVAVAGWSAGSRAPLVTHGAVFYPSPSAAKLSLSHALPKAAIALSPISPGYAGFFEEAGDDTWVHTRGPVLTMTGENDLKQTKPDLTGAGRRRAYELQPADGQRWLLYSTLPQDVGEHGSYNLDDRESADARLRMLSRALQASARAFLDASLLADADAMAWLASGNGATLAGEATWGHR